MEMTLEIIFGLVMILPLSAPIIGSFILRLNKKVGEKK